MFEPTSSAYCFLLGSGMLLVSLSVAVHNSKLAGVLQSAFVRLLKAVISILRRSSDATETVASKNTGEKLILTKGEVERKYAVGTWERQGYEDFVSILLAKEYGMKTFPCIYATKGYKADEHHYCFLPTIDPSEPANVTHIAQALLQYLPLARTTGLNTSLVIMSPPEQTQTRTINDWLQCYLQCLDGLRSYDPEPWPQDIPEQTSSERWCFCFQGIASFMAVMTPAHEKRRSRYAPNFCIVYQPKWIFDVLFSTQQKREAACKKVRNLIGHYDDIPVSPDVTHYGQEGSSEARQYFLLDENQPSICPYRTLRSK